MTLAPGASPGHHPAARIALVLICSVLLLQDVFGSHGIIAMRRTQREAAELRQQLRALDSENRSLEQQVRSLRTDKDAIECVAREDMGLARPGEFVFRIPAGKSQSQDPCSSTAPAPASPPAGSSLQPSVPAAP